MPIFYNTKLRKTAFVQGEYCVFDCSDRNKLSNMPLN